MLHRNWPHCALTVMYERVADSASSPWKPQLWPARQDSNLRPRRVRTSALLPLSYGNIEGIRDGASTPPPPLHKHGFIYWWHYLRPRIACRVRPASVRPLGPSICGMPNSSTRQELAIPDRREARGIPEWGRRGREPTAPPPSQWTTPPNRRSK